MLAALLVVVFGVAWLVGGLGAIHLSTEAVLAAGLMLLGAALVVTARTDWSLSRHAWPVMFGGVLIVGLLATSTTFGVNGALANMEIGQINKTVGPHGGTVYGGIGQLKVNATGVDKGSVVTVEHIAGETLISVPVGSTVEGKVLAGQICIGGEPASNGVGATITTNVTAPPTTMQSTPTNTSGTPPTTPSVPSPSTSGSTSAITLVVHQLAGQVVINGTRCAS